jgi:hypothetical protein
MSQKFAGHITIHFVQLQHTPDTSRNSEISVWAYGIRPFSMPARLVTTEKDQAFLIAADDFSAGLLRGSSFRHVAQDISTER